MKKILFAILVLILVGAAFGADKGKDHALFPKIKNYNIVGDAQTTGKHVCVVRNCRTEKIYGLQSEIMYMKNVHEDDGGKVVKFYEESIKSHGGEVLCRESNEHFDMISGVVHKGKKDFWVSAAKHRKEGFIEFRVVEAPVQK